MTKERLYHKVAYQIIEMIEAGIFPPGVRLPGERELGEKLGVSRVSIREALISLEAQGRIKIKMGSGAYVLDDREFMISAALPKVGPFELTEARSIIEAEAAALAAPMMTDEILEKLEGYVNDMLGDGGIGGSDQEKADRLFHTTIAKVTNNTALIYTINNLWNMRSEAMKVPTLYKTVCENDGVSLEKEHRTILDALRTRDPARARAAMQAHFKRMLRTLLVASEEHAHQEVKRKASENRSRFLPDD